MRNYLLYVLPLMLLAIFTNNHPCGQNWLFESSQEKNEDEIKALRRAQQAALLAAAGNPQYFPHGSYNGNIDPELARQIIQRAQRNQHNTSAHS